MESPFRYADLALTGHALILNRQFDRSIWCFAEHLREVGYREDSFIHLMQSLIWSGHTEEAYIIGINLLNSHDLSLPGLFLTASAAPAEWAD